MFWVLSALTMTLGNVMALRQTNIVRMLAYSSISQGGFILMPLAVAGDPGARAESLQAVIIYLLVYAASNLGAFAVVLAVSRKTRSGEISSYDGLFSYAPGLATAMTIFLASLAGVPPLAGWIAKFEVFTAVLSPGTTAGAVLAVIGAVNSVVAFGYYGRVMRAMWMRDVPDGDTAPIRVPQPLTLALGLTVAATIVIGVIPQVVLRYGDLGILHRRPRALTPALEAAFVDRLRREGPLPFSVFMEAALYDPTDGFYAAGGRAGGRSGDFLTSPEVGPLFGAVLARAIDTWWDGARPARSVRGGGCRSGTRDAGSAVLRARPDVLDGRRAALSWPWIDHRPSVSDHSGLPSNRCRLCPGARSSASSWPTSCWTTCPSGLAVFDGGWQEAFVDLDADGRFVEVLRPLAPCRRASRPERPTAPGHRCRRRPRPGWPTR